MIIYRENPLRSPGGGVKSPGGRSPGGPGGANNFVGGGGNVLGESPGSKRPLMAENDGIYVCIYTYLSTCIHIYQLLYVIINTNLFIFIIIHRLYILVSHYP